MPEEPPNLGLIIRTPLEKGVGDLLFHYILNTISPWAENLKILDAKK